MLITQLPLNTPPTPSSTVLTIGMLSPDCDALLLFNTMRCPLFVEAPPLQPAPPLHFTAEAFPAVGTFPSDHRAERPFLEEDAGSRGDGLPQQAPPPPSQLQGLKPFLQQVRGPCPPLFSAPSPFSFYAGRPGLWLHLPFRTKTLSRLLPLPVHPSTSCSFCSSSFWNFGDQPRL